MEKEEILALIKTEFSRALPEALKEAIPDIVAQVRTVLTEEARPQLRITAEQGTDLLGRAGTVSTELKNQIADMIMAGKTEREITDKILEEATAKKKPDAKDTGDLGGGGWQRRSLGLCALTATGQEGDEQNQREHSSTGRDLHFGLLSPILTRRRASCSGRPPLWCACLALSGAWGPCGLRLTLRVSWAVAKQLRRRPGLARGNREGQAWGNRRSSAELAGVVQLAHRLEPGLHPLLQCPLLAAQALQLSDRERDAQMRQQILLRCTVACLFVRGHLMLRAERQGYPQPAAQLIVPPTNLTTWSQNPRSLAAKGQARILVSCYG